MFVIYNRAIAESVTNGGRQIITTAVMTFENFLSGSVKMNTEEEIYQYISNILSEYDDRIDYSIFQFEDIDRMVMKKILNLCEFEESDEFIIQLEKIISKLTYGEKVLLYYKNNLFEFTRLPFISEKIKFIVESLEEFKSPDTRKIKNPEIIEMIDSVWRFYRTFVIYDYPTYDRVRKAMFTDRKNVLYVDTDSNFLGLNEWVCFVKDEILHNQFNKDERELDFILVNVMALFLSKTIDLGLKTLARNMNVTDEYAKKLIMKNEFYLDRIMFTDAKKRYISNTVLQEGDLLNGGLGLPD